MQEIKPVKRMRTPRYPSREAALAQPELLKLLPQRWRQCRQAAAAAGLLATMAVLSAGCERPATGNSTASLTTATITESTPMYAGAPTEPPIVSEDDALAYIRNAASTLPALTSAYDTGKLGKPIEFVIIDDAGTGYQIVSVDKKTIDLFDSRDGIGFEYIGASDGDPVSIMDQTAAKPDKTKAHIPVMDRQYAENPQDAAERFRRHVEDFLNWLKAEGIG